MVYKFFDKKSASLTDKPTKGSGVTTLTNKSLYQNQQLADELHKPIIRKFKKTKVRSTFKDNIWGADLAVKNDVVKKTAYDKLVNKVNSIDNTNFVSRTKYKKDGSDFEDKIYKIEKKIPDVSDLIKKSALTAVEN